MLVTAVFLVFVNGFFVIAEFALVKVRKTRLEELVQQGNSRARLALKVVTSFDTYLGATQLGITLASLALGWIGEPAVADLIEPVILAYFPGSAWLVTTLSIAIGFTVITFFHIVLGELVPKSMAIQQAEKLALFAVVPLYIFHRLGYPIIVLFNKAAKAILNVMGMKSANETELAHSEDELRMIVSASHRGGVLDQMESELIDNVFDFADRLAREVMVPRQDMCCLFTEDTFEENMRVVRETGHTRYPLCTEDKDHVIGMVHIRDLMDLDMNDTESKNLNAVMREILVVPEGMSVAKLLQFMRRKRTHLAVVADEYGGTAGLVALEDVLEEIVGDIQDEHDNDEEAEVRRFPDGCYEFDGRVLLDDVAELLNIRLEEPEEDTIGGYIFGSLGRRPEIGDKVNIGDYTFEVLQVNGFRVVRVKAIPIDSSVVIAEE
ncbi:hemolysin family protein [Anaerospora sp.]|jgi:CBS domain containing-hemolysin-like protein|uniref:hemolysin family protein n=1 Tax=Anaerospora sp. TaxID=1960278 RepID=UPI00289F26F6|nr:hemolysin family protein [Anaerospora sp.]